MKKKLIVISFLLFLGSAYGQNAWERTSDFPGGQQRVFNLTTTQNGSIISDSRGTGIYRSTNKGTNWTLVSTAETDVACLSTAPDGKLYALYSTQTTLNISRSDNDGITWNNIFTRPIYGITNNFYAVGGIAYLPNGHLVAAMERLIGPLVSNSASLVLRSTNAGLSWDKIWDDSAFAQGSLQDLRVLGNSIFASYSTGSGSPPVLFSDNEGFSWQSPGSFIAFGHSLALDLNGGNNGIIFSGIWTGDNVTEKLFKSTDRGVSWNAGGLPGGNVFSLFIASNRDIYAATDYSPSPWGPKIRHSTDHGQSWNLLMDGMPLGLKTYAFTGNAAGDIFAGTTVSLTGIPGGVFILRNVIGIHSNNEEIPGQYRLEQNYPNPFNPATKIKFSIPLLRGVDESRGVSVQLKIYDILGREAAVLVNEQLKPGSYEAEWNAVNELSGVYFYKLSAENFIQTKKMMLIK